MSWLKIVLVNTTHPGNIGSVARAMKTMGFSELRLVKPRRFPDKAAYDLATHAHDILDQSQQFETLQSAISDCEFVCTTSARVRKHPLQVYSPSQLRASLQHNPRTTALVFGNEQSGLDNNQINLGQKQIIIPTSREYSVLNIAQACQIILYELQFVQQRQQVPTPTNSDVTQDEIEVLFSHVESALAALEICNNQAGINMIRQIINRSGLSKRELGFLNGLFCSIQKKN